MLIFLTTLLGTLSSIFRSRAVLALENLALRHQIGVLQRSAGKTPEVDPADHLLWVWLSRTWRDWGSALAIVKLCDVRRGGAPSPERVRHLHNRLGMRVGFIFLRVDHVDGSDIDDVFDLRAALQHVHPTTHAHQDRADGVGAAYLGQQLIRSVGRAQITEDQHVGPPNSELNGYDC